MSAPGTRARARALVLDVLRAQRPGLVRGVLVGVTWQAAAVLSPLVLARAVDDGLVDRDRRALAVWVGVLLALGLVQAGTSALRHRYAISTSARTAHDLRCRLLAKVHALDAAHSERTPVGSLLSRATSDVARVETLVDAVAHTAGYAVAVVLATCLLATVDPVLAAVVLGTLALMSVVTAMTVPGARTRASALQEATARASEAAEETVTGFAVLKGLGAEPAAAGRVDDASAAVRLCGTRASRYDAAVAAVLELLPGLALALVLVLGGQRVVSGDTSLGGLVAALAYVAVLVPALRTLGARVSTVQRALASAARLVVLLDARPEVEEAPGAVPLPGTSGGVPVSLAGVRAVRDGEPVLDGVDLELAAGSRTALVGASGAGKSTLLSLLARERDPDAGRVALAGQDLRSTRSDSLRRTVVVCGHDPVLLRGTLREAVTFLRPDADEAAVARALHDAVLDDLVATLPRGLETPVGAGGQALSGGQRQRVVLARALLAEPALLLLDDVTSALDSSTEAEVVRRVSRRLDGAGTTLLVVTSSPAVLAVVDRVLLLRDGRVMEQAAGEALPEDAAGGAVAPGGAARAGDQVAP